MSEALLVAEISITDQSKTTWQILEGGTETSLPIGSLTVASTSLDECWLADVDDLARFRLPDGLSYDPEAEASLLQSKITRVKEGAMPEAVSEVEHTWQPNAEKDHGGIILDLGRTAVQTAWRGKNLFYRFPQSRARGDVEIDYAGYNQAELRPGAAHVIISPKMSRTDAPLAVAKAEGLDETDSIQVNWLGVGKDGQAIVAKTTSILVADIPLQAWVDMLADKDNLLGKSISVANPKSALAVMQVFRELDLALEKLPEGPVSLLAAVIQYIQDPHDKQKVTRHLDGFRGDQAEMHRLAISPAERWLQFDKETDQSTIRGRATDDLQAFIESLEANWGDTDRELIEAHRISVDGRRAYRMSRELSIVLQKAISNLLLTSAAVSAGNKKVLKQMTAAVAQRIYESEVALRAAQATGMHLGHIATANNSLIASLNIKVGGGCCGTVKTNFLTATGDTIASLLQIDRLDADEAAAVKELSWHGGRVKEGECKNCKDHTHVGVKNWCKPCIQNPTRSKKLVAIQSSRNNQFGLTAILAKAA